MRKKTEQKRQSIIDAAFHVFREQGFDQASMTDIAARSGASKATLYNYFESKEEMFAEIITSSATDAIRAAFSQLKSSGPVRDTLVAFGTHYLSAVLRPMALSLRRLVITESDRSGLGRAFYEQGPKHGWTALAEFLGTAMEDGQLTHANTEIATAHLRALYEAEFLDKCLLGVPVDISSPRVADAVKRAVDVFIAAYGTPKTKG